MTTTLEIRTALRERYAAPEYAMFEEVGDAGSASKVRADAVAMNMWQSRAYCLHGFEIKASRSDWLRELKNPGKADPVMQRCDHWWLVAPDDVMKPGELPNNWGYLQFRNGKLRSVTVAPRLKPKPITREFVASLLRRAGSLDETAIAERVKIISQRVRQDEREAIARRGDAELTRYKVKADAYDALLESIGAPQWTPTADITAAIRAVLASGAPKTVHKIAAVRENVARMLENIDTALSAAKEQVNA